MRRSVLLLLLTSLFAWLPQGRARLTICIADRDLASEPTRTLAAEHSCCAAGSCADTAAPDPVGPTFESSAPCDCCLEFESAAVRDPTTAPHPLEPTGAAATLPGPTLEAPQPRPERFVSSGRERARAARPPPRPTLRI